MIDHALTSRPLPPLAPPVPLRQTEFLERLPVESQAQLVSSLSKREREKVLASLPAADRQAILAELKSSEADLQDSQPQHEAGSAASSMITLSVPTVFGSTAGEDKSATEGVRDHEPDDDEEDDDEFPDLMAAGVCHPSLPSASLHFSIFPPPLRPSILTLLRLRPASTSMRLLTVILLRCMWSVACVGSNSMSTMSRRRTR